MSKVLKFPPGSNVPLPHDKWGVEDGPTLRLVPPELWHTLTKAELVLLLDELTLDEQEAWMLGLEAMDG